MRRALPDGWDVFVPSVATDGSGDGATRDTPEVLEAVQDAEIYFGFGVSEGILKVGANLAWVHSAAAGVGPSLSPTMLGGRVVFTNSAGIHAAPMAETVLAMILYFGRGLDFAVEGQRRAEWWQEPYFEVASPIVELADATVGILGFGGIGKEVARRVAALGARVVALKRKPPSPADAALEPVSGGASLAPRIEVLHGAAGLDRMLGESDILVVTAPETAETRGLMDRDALRRMRQGALLVNVARGRIVDEAALVDALAAGRLRGAGLDVFPREPLPPEHPLWKLPNVLLTPHVSGVTRGFWRRETDLIVRNLQRYLAGAPVDEWENVVDKLAGY
jgi:phosphoglycerate dehydrogenase-like enzyme